MKLADMKALKEELINDGDDILQPAMVGWRNGLPIVHVLVHSGEMMVFSSMAGFLAGPMGCEAITHGMDSWVASGTTKTEVLDELISSGKSLAEHFAEGHPAVREALVWHHVTLDGEEGSFEQEAVAYHVSEDRQVIWEEEHGGATSSGLGEMLIKGMKTGRKIPDPPEIVRLRAMMDEDPELNDLAKRITVDALAMGSMPQRLFTAAYLAHGEESATIFNTVAQSNGMEAEVICMGCPDCQPETAGD